MNDETRGDETMDTATLTKRWDEYGRAVDAMVADRTDETIGAMHAAMRAYSAECARTGLYVMPGTGDIVALERSEDPSIGEIRERADWKWSSGGIECLVALDGATYVATLVEGEHVQRVKLGAFPEYDCLYGDLEPVAEGEGDDAEPLRIDANLIPMGTVWWLGESAFLVDEIDAGTSAVDHDIDPFGVMRVHDACGELVDYCECDPPSGEAQPASLEIAGDVVAARKLLATWDAAQSDLAEATNEDGEIDFNSRAWERYEDRTDGLAGAFAEIVRAALEREND